MAVRGWLWRRLWPLRAQDEQRPVIQAERMRSASNSWEADPWDASDAIADAQLAGFRERAAKPIDWAPVRGAGPYVHGIEYQQLIGANVEFHAVHDGEDMLLMQLDWHGFPDPPEWRLATRPSGSDDTWETWGYFADLPANWRLPSDSGGPTAA